MDHIAVSPEVEKVLNQEETELGCELIDPKNPEHRKALMYDPTSMIDDALDGD